MKSSLPILAATLLCLTSARAAQVNFKDIASTNVVKTNDLLLVDSALGGTNYATRTAPIARVVGFGVVTNALSMDGDTNKFVNGKGLLTPIYGTVTNLTLIGTNGIVVAGVTNGTNITILVGGDTVLAGYSTIPTNTFAPKATTLAGYGITDGFAPTQVSLTHAGTVTLNLTPTITQADLSLTGAVTVATSNLAIGHSYTVFGSNPQATNCAPTFPVGWAWQGGAPPTITAGASWVLSIYSRSTTDASVYAAYTENQ